MKKFVNTEDFVGFTRNGKYHKGTKYISGVKKEEGEWLNNKLYTGILYEIFIDNSNFRGKFYYKSYLVFEGIFKNGIPYDGTYYNGNKVTLRLINGNGNGTIYHYDKVFEGEIKDGKYYKGTEYRSNGNKMFEGEW